MASGRKNRRGTLLLGLLLLGIGLVLVLAPAGSGLAGWLMQLWPVFLICAGVVRVMGFAVERKPRSPLIGMLLIVVGVLFLAARFQPSLNALQVYGRYWVLLLIVFGSVELVRYYSHRQTEGPPPRVFTPIRVIVVLLIVVTGVLASRAANNSAVLSALRLPGFLSGLRDSVVGNAYAFTDQPIINTDVRPGMRVSVNNGYGSVKISGGASAVKATLVKGVRGWSEDEARKIADRIHLIVNQSPEGLTIGTNRDEVNEQFTTDIQIDLPAYAVVSVVDSYGAVTAGGIQGLIVKASYGQAEVSGVRGDVNLSLSYSDVTASNIDGDLTINGAKRARISNLSGGLDLNATGGAVDLREISGPIRVSAPFSRIVAQGLDQRAELKTEHASVEVTRAAELVIEAPHSDVRLKNIDGDVKISSSNSNIQLASISGDVEVHAEQSSVSADDVRSNVTIETSHGDVTVKNFLESIRVETSYRDVTLISAEEPAGNIEVQNNHGQIKLIMPPSSRFQLDAQSANGQILPVGFSQFEKKVRESLVGTLGLDGPTIKLRTSYKNIIIQASAPRQTQASRVVNPIGERREQFQLSADPSTQSTQTEVFRTS